MTMSASSFCSVVVEVLGRSWVEVLISYRVCCCRLGWQVEGSLRCQGCVGGCPDVLVSRTSIASSQSFLRDDSRCQMVWLQPA